MAKTTKIPRENPSLLEESPKQLTSLLTARLLLLIFLASYFYWLPTPPLLLQKQTIYWIIATFGSFRLANWWMFLHTPPSTSRIRIETWLDMFFASAILLFDSNSFPLSLFVLLCLLMANAVQHGGKTYFELLSVAGIFTILSCTTRQILLNKPIYYPFLGGIILVTTCIYLLTSLVRQNERYKELAIQIKDIDSLTGMLNQHAFIRAANYLITLAQRTPMPMMLFMAEIENFHNLNEKLGQRTGDLILKHLSRITLINLRRNDVSARYTNNTFVFLITNVDKKSAEIVAIRLQYEFALWADKEKLETSISFAMTTIPDYNITIQILLKHLGRYLYTSKKIAGLPGVVHAPPLSVEDIVKLNATA